VRMSAPKALCGWWLLWLAAGCGGGGDQVVITLSAPAPGQVLTADDDTSSNRPGMQFDLAGTSHGVAYGTTVDVFIDGDLRAVSAKVETDGAIHIPNVTLDPGMHRIYVQTSTGSEASDERQTYTLVALAISAPNNRAELTEDENPTLDGFQTSIEVSAYALAPGQVITLQVDKEAVATATAGDEGEAVFSDVTLISGKHTLLAYSGEGTARIHSREVQVEVVQKCSVTFIRPEPPQAGADLMLGGHDACPATGDTPFSTQLMLSTDVGDGRKAKLTVNGQPVAMTTVKGSIVTFDDVVLDKQTSANTIEVELETSNADSCVADYPSKIFVDCEGADCSITGPVPFAYVGPDGEQKLFLNRSNLREGNRDFQIDVATDKALAGHPVELIVDGNSLEAPSSDAVAGEKNATASFSVVLDERSHTLQAQCTDLAGNVTRSSKLTWVVDVTACSVDITDPAEGTALVPADDDNAGADGIQVVVSAGVEGDDCNARRAAVCDSKAGILGVPFQSYDRSSPLLSAITLDATEAAQTLCVEVQDHAGNSARDQVAVSLRSAAPQALIESPAQDAKYNAAGGDGYTKDADTSSAECDASFSVACSDIGTLVELRHDSPTGAVFASAPCAARAHGDAALPAGYSGRAKLTAAFEDADGNAAIVATQTITGSSSHTLVGASAVRAIRGDCSPPAPQFGNDPCAIAAANQLDEAQAQDRDVEVLDATRDVASATLNFLNSDGSSGTRDATSIAAGLASWANLDLGGQGTLTLTAIVSDDFDNSVQISCMAAVVSDLPAFIVFTAPADNAVFNSGDACDTGHAGELGVRIQAVADQQADRSALVQVNGVIVMNAVPIAADGAIDVCVPVPDNDDNVPVGPSSVLLKLSSTVSGGFAQQSRSVNVHAS
jgi:hypothetical protein